MLEILLIRHGQTDWNRDRRIMGQRPIPLNGVGWEQASALARALAEIPLDGIYSSPILRAVQTARILKKGRKNPKLIMAPELAEIDYGTWVGKTFQEVSIEKGFHTYHVTPSKAQAPKGEKMTSVHRRAVRFIQRLRKKHKDGRIVLVSHADVIKIILVHYLGLHLDELLRLRIDNGSVSLLWFHEKRQRVMAMNCPPSPEHLFLGTDQLLPSHLKKLGLTIK